MANAALTASAAADSQPGDDNIVTRVEYIMGTTFTISLLAKDQAAFDAAFALIRAHDAALSDYDPESELMRLQPLARQDWTAASPLLCKALRESRYYGLISDGAFDISVGPLLRLWGFKDRQYRVPSAAEIAAARAAVGWNRIGLQSGEAGSCRFRLWHPGTALDFGGIGKGLALDAAAELLQRHGVKVAALDAGSSSMRFLAPPAGSPRGWPVLARNGDETLWLSHKALASSDSGEQSFAQKGVRYGHLFDPRTGWPIPAARGMTVLAATATAAEALTKAALILPPAKAAALAKLTGSELRPYTLEPAEDTDKNF